MSGRNLRIGEAIIILLQRKDVLLPKSRDLVAQIHAIKRGVLGSSKVSFDAERTKRGGHADRFGAVTLACQRERALGRGRAPRSGFACSASVC